MLLKFKSSSFALHLTQMSVIIIFLVLGITTSLVTPILKGRDELAHFRFIEFVAQHKRLPLSFEERGDAGYKSAWPPLFHFLTGLVGNGINSDSPPPLKTAHNNPRIQIVFGPEGIQEGVHNLAIPTEDPFQGEILLFYLARWLTLICAFTAIGIFYWLIYLNHPNAPWLALSGAAVLAFIPEVTQVIGTISYEPLLGMWIVLYLLFLFQTVQNPTRRWYYFVLGLLMGLAISTKYTPLPAVLIVPLLIIWLTFRERWSWSASFQCLGLFGMGLCLTFGIWLLYMEIYFNQVAESGWVSGLFHPFITGDLAVGDEATRRFTSMFINGQWGVVKGISDDNFLQWLISLLADIWDMAWLMWIFLGLFGVALIGVARQWSRMTQHKRLWIILLIANIGLFMFLPALRFLLTGDVNETIAAGQLVVFLIVPPVILLMAQGLRAYLSIPWVTGVFFIIAVLNLGQSINSISQLYTPPWPIRTVPFTDDEQLLVGFDNLSLTEYDLTTDDETLQITLYWRAEFFINEDYLIQITLLDSDLQPQARWLGQPLNGRYPTRAWSPEDRVRDLIRLPINHLKPGSYQVQLNVLDEKGVVKPTSESTLSKEDNHYNLGPIALNPARLSTDTLELNQQVINYTFQKQEEPYAERAAVVLSTETDLDDAIEISLIGPDHIARKPVDHTGHTYIFWIEPHFVGGQYRFRFEQRDEAELMLQIETDDLFQVQTQQRQFHPVPMSSPVSANFAGNVALLGYDLPKRRVQPGDNLPVTLHWQSLKTIGADLITFYHLVNINNPEDVWKGKDRRPHYIYSTFIWAPGEVVTDPYEFNIDPNMPDGIYYLLVGLYLSIGKDAAISLPLTQSDGQLTDRTSVRFGPIKVGNTPPGLTVERIDPQVTLNQPFGNPPGLTLLGYDLANEAGNPIQNPESILSAAKESKNIKLTLYWRSEAILPVDYTTFVHLRNATGEIVAQKDQPPLIGAYPTSLWDPGEIIADEIILPLPNNLTEREYHLVIGLYDFQNGQRLVVPDHPNNEISLLKFFSALE